MAATVLWQWVTSGLGDGWVVGLLAVFLAAVGVGFWSSYLRADDTSIVIGFLSLVTRRCDRKEVAAIDIDIGWSPKSGHGVRFLRSDGTLVFRTTLEWWGNDQIARLVGYLGVPVQRL